MSEKLPFEIPDGEKFVSGMQLTTAEIDLLSRYLDVMEQADKHPEEFLRSEAAAFTPGALLVVAVAEFAYRVYCDYGKAMVTPEMIQSQWKKIAKELASIEAGGEAALGVNSYARMRKGLLAAKKQR